MMKSLLPMFALSLGLVTGCSGDDDPTDNTDNEPTDNTDDDTTPTGDTAPEGPEYLEIATVDLFGAFGFDGLGVVDVNLPDQSGTLQSAIYLTFGTLNWNGYYDDIGEFCQVTIPLAGATLAEWAIEDTRLIYGVDWDSSNAATTDCHDDTDHLPVDPALWGTDMAADWSEGIPYGIGVGDWSDELTQYIEDNGTDTTEAFKEDGWLGGRLVVPDNLEGGPDLDEVYAFGFKIDDTNTLLTDPDDDTLLDDYTYDEIVPTGVLPIGYYEVNSYVYWTFAR